MALPGLIQVLNCFCVCFPLGSLVEIYVLIYTSILSLKLIVMTEHVMIGSHAQR
jgi:hypothetical protein